MATFEQLFPTFLQKCAELHELLRIVAFMLFIVGTILQVLHGFTGKTLILHMVRLFVLTALLVMLPQWGNEAQRILQTSILDGLGVDPSQVQEQYSHLLEVRRDTGSDRSWWDILGDLNAFTVELLISGILWLVGYFAALLLFWAYIIQKFILFSAYALSPLLIGFMAIRPLRSIGTRYLMNIVGVLLWPLGWAVAALITDLDQRGMLDDTLVVVTGEFGRTPRINARGGRDHWGGLAPLLLSGGGYAMGRTIGHSNSTGSEPAANPVRIPNLLATIMGTLFETGELRITPGVPNEVLKAATAADPIAGL